MPVAAGHSPLKRVQDVDLIAEAVSIDTAGVLEQMLDGDVLEAQVFGCAPTRSLQLEDLLHFVGQCKLSLAYQLVDRQSGDRLRNTGDTESRSGLAERPIWLTPRAGTRVHKSLAVHDCERCVPYR